MAKKRTATGHRKQDAGLRRDVLEAIERVWPDGVVDMTFDSEESYFWDTHPRLTRAFQVLQDLCGAISAILEKHGISVLPKEEWSKPVPWLRGGEEAFVGMGRPIRVLDAFFFEGL